MTKNKDKDEKNIIKSEEVIPDTHFFIYKNKKYPFKIDYFKYASKYFSKYQKEPEVTNVINLLTEEEECKYSIPSRTIQDFVNFVQHKKISLCKDNAIFLNFLSTKYEVLSLKNKTSEYIENHQRELVIELLKEQEEYPQIDSMTYENIISRDLFTYLHDDRLLTLKVPTLYRIIQKWRIIEKQSPVKENCTNDEKERRIKQINEFLFRVLDEKGECASVLFENHEFGSDRNEYVIRLLQKYSEVFEFSYINKELRETFNSILQNQERLKEELISERSKNEIEMNKLMNEEKQMKEQIFKIEQEKSELKKTIETERIQNSESISIEKKKQDEQNEEIVKLKKEISELNEKMKNQQEHQAIPLLLDQNNLFNGIIKYLTNKTGGNIHNNGTIQIISNGHDEYFGPEKLLFFDSDTYFCSTEEDAWILLDFKRRKVKLTNYSIKSKSDDDNGHLKSWIIEISNNGEEWTKIDERTNCSTLNGKGNVGVFNVSANNFSRYVRLKQTDHVWGDDDYFLWFDYFEFYGYLEE